MLSCGIQLGGLLRPTYGEQDRSKRGAAWAEIAAGPWKVWFNRIDEAIAKNGSGYVVGDSLTIADLRAYAFWIRKFDGVSSTYFDQYPHISAHIKKISNHPLVAAYYAKACAQLLFYTHA